MTDGHLTDEQLSNLIAGAGTDSTSHDHLRICSQCREELESFRESLGAASHLGLLWAEQEAPRRVPLPLPAMERWRARSLWAIPATLAAVWAIILSTNQMMHRQAETPQVVATPSASYTMADDNRLMADIDRALNTEVVPQVPVSELRQPSEHTHQHFAPKMVN